MRVFKAHKPPLKDVAFLPDGRTIAVAHLPGIVTCWDLESGSQIACLEARKNMQSGRNRVEAIAVSPDGQLLGAAGDSLTVWDCTSWQPVVGFDLPASSILRDIVFTMHGTRLLGALDSNWNHAPDNVSLAMWDVVSGNAVPLAWARRGPVRALIACPDGASVVAKTDFQTFRWHLPTEQEHPIRTGLGSSCAVEPVTGMLAGGSYRTVEISDPDGDRLLARWEAHTKGVFALAFSSDGKSLATGSGDELVKVWDVSGIADVLADPNAKPLTTIPEKNSFTWDIGPVRAVAFSPDGLTAAAVGDRVKFMVWDVG